MERLYKANPAQQKKLESMKEQLETEMLEQ
jgi:hypothetical protein